jgi:hypothetical protein
MGTYGTQGVEAGIVANEEPSTGFEGVLHPANRSGGDIQGSHLVHSLGIHFGHRPVRRLDFNVPVSDRVANARRKRYVLSLLANAQPEYHNDYYFRNNTRDKTFQTQEKTKVSPVGAIRRMKKCLRNQK